MEKLKTQIHYGFRIKKLFSYTLIILSFITLSCEKDAKDFRNKYTGKYLVTEEVSCYGPCSTCYRLKDTIISVEYGETKQSLSVLGRDVTLDSMGYYHDYHYGLRLWNDSIWSYFMNGGLGCGQRIIYTGAKISD